MAGFLASRDKPPCVPAAHTGLLHTDEDATQLQTPLATCTVY